MQVSTVKDPSILPVFGNTSETAINLEISDIDIGNGVRAVVDAHELHTAMQVKTRFSVWMLERISRFIYRENEDFIIYLNRSDKKKKGRPFKCYFLTLEMARTLAAYEKTVRSMQVMDHIERAMRRIAAPYPASSLSVADTALKQGPEATDLKPLQTGSTRKGSDTGSRSGKAVKISLSTKNTRRPVTKLVRELCKTAGMPLDVVYRTINRQFDLSSITRLPNSRIGEVVDWLKK